MLMCNNYNNNYQQLNLFSPTSGPDLPLEVTAHCVLALNNATTLLIVGRIQGGTRVKTTFYYNSDYKTWTEGPSLITGTSYHSCALFKSPKHGHTDTVIVTGMVAGIGMVVILLALNSSIWRTAIRHSPQLCTSSTYTTSS
jgi:hypothetical protein